ncbi:MAG: DUF3995 domain-containing protein [Armatimonadetes bacterium]|nr:DUF3995 domain-containing protein [Armatimonadota bacterium]
MSAAPTPHRRPAVLRQSNAQAARVAASLAVVLGLCAAGLTPFARESYSQGQLQWVVIAGSLAVISLLFAVGAFSHYKLVKNPRNHEIFAKAATSIEG